MSERPDFLNRPHVNGETIVAAFRALPKSEAAEVDRWLLVNSSYGSTTWQEDCLYAWINEHEDLDAAFELRA